jgi:hypothetical protein
MNPLRHIRRLALPLALALPATAAQALQIHDVKVPASASVGARQLVLNGAGTRYFLVFKVYVAELYLPQRTTTASAALQMPGPKLLRLVMLRDVSGDELGTKLTHDIQANVSTDAFNNMIDGLARMGQLFAQHKELHSGDVIELADVPGQGMTVTIDGQSTGAPFSEPGFFDNMLKVWLGDHPAAQRLKQALLGDAKSSD